MRTFPEPHMSSSCPFCHLTIPLLELEWHVNDHLVEEELARDMDLARQIASAPSPPRVIAVPDKEAESFDFYSGEALESSTSRSNSNANDYGETRVQEKISCLVCLQLSSTIHKIEGGLMLLLRKCLEMESGKSSNIISGHVDHFQSIESEDSGWGCGWRNIQMLSSHLLMQRREAREVMFGGSGFVPDIPSLQRWLEIAWEMGFDMTGSDSFNHKVYGSTKWIGTTECASLFRSFGLRARIVDFGSKAVGSSSSSVHDNDLRTQGIKLNSRGKRTGDQVYGPMDKFLQVDPIKHGKYKKADIWSGADLTACTHENNHGIADHDKLNNHLVKKIDRHQCLVDWVWSYFTDKGFSRSDNSERVIVSEKTPLYFQHDGHSRTIVGIQIQKGPDGMPERHSLLILDPAHRTSALERSLRENSGWQKLIKRGAHTLKKPQYQLCFVDPGIAHGAEMDQLKTLDSIYFEF
ncbi:uncharacterized protein LOC131248751 [Magnolia sinica]|uniref:uncharacterized protein LOC131248751 n=1 Tax=Magnolia sinica TaxID=86752 RepID=UPI0026598A42|nr:uncharacterized protein LOC131248751 [Magnolia sinica]